MFHDPVIGRAEGQRERCEGSREFEYPVEVVLERADVEELVQGAVAPMRGLTIVSQRFHNFLSVELWFGCGIRFSEVSTFRTMKLH